MDTHLQSLSDTLDAIRRIHKRSAKPSRPFTAAILNTGQLDVLDFIRDADQFEANLFWYPPAGSSIAGQSTMRETGQAIMPDIDGAPRKPEARVVLPPTPLRKNARDAEARGLVEFDARTLLKAAHRLLDNYHNAPRARKHVRSLLKKHSELQKTVRDLEENVMETDVLIEQLHAKGKDLRASLSLMKSSRSVDAHAASKNQQNSDLAADIQREEMEIMALEQMIEDARAQGVKVEARKSMSKKLTDTNKRAGIADKSKRMVATPQKVNAQSPPAKKGDSATKTPRQPSTSASAFRATLAASSRKSVAPTPSRKLVLPNPAPHGDETIRLDVAAAAPGEANYADETIRLQPSVAAEEREEGEEGLVKSLKSTSGTVASAIQISDELEKVCENIWRIFGDHLRYAAPSRESAGYTDTLQILHLLSVGAQSSGPNNTQEASFASEATAATSGSTVGSTSTLTNLGVPAPSIAMDSYILLLMLKSPPPHKLELEGLYQEADRWWAEEGRNSYRTNTGANEAQLKELSEGGPKTFATRAVYDLVAKKLLRIQYGKHRLISFAVYV